MSAAQSQMSETDAFDAGERSGPLELPTCGEDVSPARAAYECRETGCPKRHLERLYRFVGWRRVRHFRPWVPGDQIDFRACAAQKLSQFMGLRCRVVDSAQQHILESKLFVAAKRKLARGLQKRLDIPFAVDGHYLLADHVVRRVQRDRQLRPYFFFREIVDPRHDP